MLFQVCVEVPEQGHEVGASPPLEVEKLRQAEERLESYRRATTVLREAINAKGANLSEDALLDEYATAVESLPTAQPFPPIKMSRDLSLTGGHGGFWSFTEMVACPPLDTSESIDLYCLFYGCSKLKALPTHLDLSNAIKLDYFMSKSGVVEASIDAVEALSVSFLADGCQSLKSLYLHSPKCTNYSSVVRSCMNLTDLRINGLKASLSLLGTAVTMESVTYIIEHAQQAISGAILTLPRAMERTMPEELIEQAVEKGFEVTFK